MSLPNDKLCLSSSIIAMANNSSMLYGLSLLRFSSISKYRGISSSSSSHFCNVIIVSCLFFLLINLLVYLQQEDDWYEFLQANPEVASMGEGHQERNIKILDQCTVMNQKYPELNWDPKKFRTWLGTRRKDVSDLMGRVRSGDPAWNPEEDESVSAVKKRAWRGLHFLKASIQLRSIEHKAAGGVSIFNI